MRTHHLAVPSLLGLLVVAALAAAAWAQSEDQLLDGKLRADQQIMVGSDEVVEHDLYASGGFIVIDGTVEGDLLAAASKVLIRGTVTGDAMVTGGVVRIPGSVEGSVRALARELEVGGDVGEDVVALGAESGGDRRRAGRW